MKTEEVDIPTDSTLAMRKTRYNHSTKGQAYRRVQSETRHDRRLEAYLSREFIAWDGEGINEPDGSHTYCLIANSRGARLAAREGLSTVAVFDMFLASDRAPVHIIYGGSYDINMILRDVDIEKLQQLYTSGSTVWNGYWIEWRGGKSLRVKKGRGKAFTLYDVLPFFQCPFVKACDQYLGTSWDFRDEIIREKARRGSFSYDEIEGISEYNNAELHNLVRLCDELKTRLHKVGIRIARWDGPGAIASAIYQKQQIKSFYGEIPVDAAEYGRYAYAGGRFEIIRKGHSDLPVYQYDIRSAYPSAIRYLPCLAHGEWRHVIEPTTVARFGVYRIEVDESLTPSATQPQPLWRRNKDGTVYFSEYPEGFYWSPEAQIALDLGCPIVDGWEYSTVCECDPFGFVEPMYNKRAALKKAGDGAHVGLKLGLNSLYGKLAQQIGWSPGPPLRIPPYHCLEWAGWITSHCRAQVYRAAMLAPNDVIAFETDAIFSRVPLDLPLGDRLGQWELTEYSSMTYFKSGMYFGTQVDGTEVIKARGLNPGTLTRPMVISALASQKRGAIPLLYAEQTRFIGIGQALAQDWSKWTRWITTPRKMNVSLSGKRIDLLDSWDEYAMKDDGWEETQIGIMHIDEQSHPYEVEWINPSPVMHNPKGERISEVRNRQAMETWEYDN